ncbi:MAG: heme-binding domain-containing protein [Bacteroidetes bacterium]|nr:heme-binding domain-containing protein [Bacteroidota bacterium]
MSGAKKIVWTLLIVFIAMQFVQPVHNKSEQVLATDFTKIYPVPDSIQLILKRACYDCHSNNSNYPWYSNIQPVAWMMARHISNGKDKLNFSDFGSYTNRRQISKLKGIANQIKDDEMPIASYKLMHPKARLLEAEKEMIMNWMNATADSLSSSN